jgi:PAS domain S-box-containing protein
VPVDPLVLCNAAPCALFALDAKTRIGFANRAGLALLGAVPSQLLGSPFLDHVAASHRALVAAALGPAPFTLEAPLVDGDGRPIPTSLRGEATTDGWSISAEHRGVEVELRTQLAAARAATEFQLTRAIEMSERAKELRDALDGDPTLSTRGIRAEDELERALASAGLATWHWDAKLGGVTLRGACETYFGFRPKNLLEIREGITEPDRDLLWRAAERARAERAPIDVRVHIRSREGVTRLVRVTGSPRDDLRGDFAGVDGSLVDATDQERATSSLELLDHELRLLVEGMFDGLALVGRDWKVRYINRKGAELLERTPEETQGRHVTEIVPPTAGEAFRNAHRRVMDERVPVEIEDTYAPLGRTFVNRIYPTADGIAIFFQDVTERRRREERLRTSEQRLRELGARMRDAREEEARRIAREIHDDLGQALTVLKMDLARVRAKAGVDPALAEPIAQMNEVVDGAIATTRRIASDLRPTILDDLGLAAAIAWHAEQVSERAGFEVDVEVTPSDVAVDAVGGTVLYRVLQEALTNIVRHATAKRVTVRLRERSGHVELVVRDDGVGFDPEAATRSLGLLGMRERTASVGGSLQIESTRGKGTTVRATVPRKVAFEQTATTPDATGDAIE